MTTLIAKGYCGSCGNWVADCKTIIVDGIPEKVCPDCREGQ